MQEEERNFIKLKGKSLKVTSEPFDDAWLVTIIKIYGDHLHFVGGILIENSGMLLTAAEDPQSS